MTSNNLLPATVLKRKAVVYVRQSTPGQVQNNLESQRRQYELVDVARRWGFRDESADVDLIGDDAADALCATHREGKSSLADCADAVCRLVALEPEHLAEE